MAAALEADLLDQDTPALWLKDVVSAMHRYLYMEWLVSVDDARTRLCGVTRAPLRSMAAWSRADQIMFSRSRTDALLELGTYRLRHFLDHVPLLRHVTTASTRASCPGPSGVPRAPGLLATSVHPSSALSHVPPLPTLLAHLPEAVPPSGTSDSIPSTGPQSTEPQAILVNAGCSSPSAAAGPRVA